MHVLILDNYDSFTYNLYHYAEQLCPRVEVHRNDALSLGEVARYSHVIISPGPGLPEEAGITMPLIRRYAQEKPILGVCLGFQALALWGGASLYNQKQVTHGLSRKARRLGESWLLKGLPQTFAVGLYHSWAVQLPAKTPLNPIACLENNTLMAFEHPELPLAGVQFHPESIMTEHGLDVLRNWLEK